MLTTVVLKEFKPVMTTANYILCPLNGGETHQERRPTRRGTCQSGRAIHQERDPPGGRPTRREIHQEGRPTRRETPQEGDPPEELSWRKMVEHTLDVPDHRLTLQ